VECLLKNRKGDSNPGRHAKGGGLTQEQPIARMKGHFPMNILMVRTKVQLAHVAETEEVVK